MDKPQALSAAPPPQALPAVQPLCQASRMDNIVRTHAWAQDTQVAGFEFGAGLVLGRIGDQVGAATHFVVDHTSG